MKKYISFAIFATLSLITFSQTCPTLYFLYDASGNRIQENYDVSCDNNNNNQRRRGNDTNTKDSSVISSISARIYPNPAVDNLNIQIQRNGLPAGDSRIYLYDLTGRIVQESNTNEDYVLLQISSLAAGPYMVKVISNGKQCVYLISKCK